MRHLKTGISRRGLLKAAGLGAASLPLMPLLSSTARAQGRFPRRLVIVFTANGTIYDEWLPSGGERDFELKRILAPLERHRQDLIILGNMRAESARNGPGDDHQKGMGHILTGVELLEGNTFPGCGGDCAGAGWGGGPSVDQVIAQRIGRETRFDSLLFGVQVRSNDIWSRMSYAAANQPLPPLEDPYMVFDRLFADASGEPSARVQLRAERRSILDRVTADLVRLERSVPAADKAKLQAHLSAIRAIERRLDEGPMLGEGCITPNMPDRFDINANDNFPMVGGLQTELMVAALACDLTRVATFQWSRSVSQTRMTWLGIREGHHDLSHEPDNNADAREKLIQIDTWYAERFAELLDQMKAIPEGDGTLLDNTAVVWVNELAKGNTHSHVPQPFLLAGGMGGEFQTGRYLNVPGTRHNDLLLSLCHGMGLDDLETFGNPAYSRGPLDRLKG